MSGWVPGIALAVNIKTDCTYANLLIGNCPAYFGSGNAPIFPTAPGMYALDDRALSLFAFGPTTSDFGTTQPMASMVIASGTVPTNQAPVASLSTCSNSTCVSENGTLSVTVPPGSTAPVSFSAANSFDPDGTIAQYRWLINSTFVSSALSFSFSLGAGNHNILLTVTDNDGANTTVGALIIVQQFAPSPGPPSPAALSDGFDYPISSVFRPNRAQGDLDGWFVLNYFGNNLRTPPCTFHFHPGDDWNRDDGKDAGETVRAVSNGKVEAIRALKISEGTRIGQGIAISHTLPDGTKVFSVYVHVTANPAVATGMSVRRGDPIATIAAIKAFGPHLHFEIRSSFDATNWYPQDDGCGYYDSLQAIQTVGFVEPVVFSDTHRP